MGNVLIVEDNAPFRQMLNDALSAELAGKADVHEAENGQDALELFRSVNPELVFLDINIPGPYGLLLIGMMKAEHPACKVVILTNHDSWEYREAAQKAGAEHFFSKRTTTMEEIMALARNLYAG